MLREISTEKDGCVKHYLCRGGGWAFQSVKRAQVLKLLRDENWEEDSEGKQGRRQIGHELRNKPVSLGSREPGQGTVQGSSGLEVGRPQLGCNSVGSSEVGRAE